MLMSAKTIPAQNRFCGFNPDRIAFAKVNAYSRSDSRLIGYVVDCAAPSTIFFGPAATQPKRHRLIQVYATARPGAWQNLSFGCKDILCSVHGASASTRQLSANLVLLDRRPTRKPRKQGYRDSATARALQGLQFCNVGSAAGTTGLEQHSPCSYILTLQCVEQ